MTSTKTFSAMPLLVVSSFPLQAASWPLALTSMHDAHIKSVNSIEGHRYFIKIAAIEIKIEAVDGFGKSVFCFNLHIKPQHEGFMVSDYFEYGGRSDLMTAMHFKRIGQRVIQFIRERRAPTNQIVPVNQMESTTSGSSLLLWFKAQLRQLCEQTALHGYNHIVRPEYTVLERSLWIFAVSSAFITAVVLLWISWTWDAETPTVTVIESTNYAIWKVYFPAVTICNLNKISAAGALRKAESMARPDNMSAVELAGMFRLLLHVNGLAEANRSEYNKLQNILWLNNLEVTQLMGEFAQPCSNMLDRCMWKGTQWRCENLFQPINSTEGLCCSFNYYGIRNSVYRRHSTGSILGEPRRVAASGYYTGLSVLLNPEVEDYHTTDIATTGFKVIIHHSYNYPDQNAETRIVGAQLESFISIQPKEIYTTEDALALEPSVRNCYAHNEVRLSVMKRYSFLNCMIECRTLRIFEKCGCIPYNLPSNGTFANCEPEDMECLMANKELYQSAVPTFNLSITETRDDVPSPCRCLPSCEMVQYPVEMSSGRLNRTFSYNSAAFFKDINLKDHSVVHVYFNDLVSTRFRKDKSQSCLGVLASFGGILGLFLGFSIITGFEVIYFFSIRVLFDVFTESWKRNRRGENSNSIHWLPREHT
ncbi:sodium channel protein Nach-like [Topomyia yanbarensis]|uniref:sodium channel protein Nach-like n=1 Tax=Topomyia yanbarensis TaxID=2498891 RepID=UPI00273BD6B3|nr:sodium channel protein Nach-like [Topomyia yanbarensis]